MSDQVRHVEREYKFELPPGGHLDSLAPALEALGFTLEPEQFFEIDDTYLDTPDWWFFRAGQACRLRRVGKRIILIVKQLAPQVDGLAIRREVKQDLASAPPETTTIPQCDLGDRLCAAMAPRKAGAIFRIINQRQTWQAHGLGGLHVEASLDTVVVEAGDRRGEFREIELELKAGDAAQLDQVATDFARTLGCTPATASKYERGLEVLGVTPQAEPKHELDL